jgi:DNA-binding NarL/FixJ family response regulator
MLTNVLLVDDHPMFRKGLRMLLETEKDIRVVGEAGDGQAAVEQVRVLSPDVVIMDISMPSLNGIEATRQILSGSPKTKVAALSIHGGKQFVKDMLGAGASAYILKDSVPEELINGIRKVMRNEVYLSDAITDVVITGFMDGGAADESTAILGSKLTRPATTSARLVDRPLFISRLEEGLKGRVTLISAPAGYGKTTLAAQWLGRSRRLSAWLSLDKRESEPERFLRYVVSAIRNAVPGFGSAIWPLLSCAHLSPPGDLADAMISDLAVLKEPLLLVVDDYQTIVSEPVQAVLLRMVEHLPDSLHLVILTRVDPPWPLARWRARQWLNEFRAGDLRFSKEETQLLLGQYAKTPLASETVDMLCSRTEGWVAALQLVRLSLAEDKNPDQFARNFSESDRLAIDYL